MTASLDQRLADVEVKWALTNLALERLRAQGIVDDDHPKVAGLLETLDILEYEMARLVRERDRAKGVDRVLDAENGSHPCF